MTRISSIFSLFSAYLTLGIATSTIQANGAMVDYSTLIAYLNNPTMASVSTSQLIGTTGPGSNEILFNTSSAIIPAVFNGNQATVSNQVILIVERPMVLKDARAVARAISTSGQLTLEKLSSNQASGSGVALITATLNIANANNTVQVGTLNATTASITLAANDRINMIASGNFVGAEGVNLTAMLAPV